MSDDDRITCRDCTQYKGGPCAAAQAGKLPMTSRQWRPNPDMRHRCKEFVSKSTGEVALSLWPWIGDLYEKQKTK